MTKLKIVLVALIFLFPSKPTFPLEPEEQKISKCGDTIPVY
jgi:hypothetical protein